MRKMKSQTLMSNNRLIQGRILIKSKTRQINNSIRGSNSNSSSSNSNYRSKDNYSNRIKGMTLLKNLKLITLKRKKRTMT